MTSCSRNLPVTYREYKFAADFPILLMEVKSTTPQIDFIHFHNCIEIAFCQSGTMTWNLENQVSSLSPGNICFLPPFFTHGSFFPPQEGEVSCSYLFFNPEQLLAPFYPNGLPSEFTWYQYTDFYKLLSGEQFCEEVELIRMIIGELTDRVGHYRTAVRGMVETLLVLLYRKHQGCSVFGGGGSSLPQLFPAISYLDSEYAAELDTAHLAYLCGLSSRQFMQRFQESFQQTPLQYLRIVRIQKACRMLTSSETGILDIALQTGFHSLSSFNRYFHKIVGSSPQAFRNDRRAIVKKDPRYAPYRAT